jgi:hypothetical protein
MRVIGRGSARTTIHTFISSRQAEWNGGEDSPPFRCLLGANQPTDGDMTASASEPHPKPRGTVEPRVQTVQSPSSAHAGGMSRILIAG